MYYDKIHIASERLVSGRHSREILKPKQSGYSFIKSFSNVDLPLPEGPQMTTTFLLAGFSSYWNQFFSRKKH